MNKKTRALTAVILISALMLACTMPFGPGAINPTTVAQTFAAGLTETVLAIPAGSTATSAPPAVATTAAPTQAPSSTDTTPPTATMTYTPTVPAVTTPCNRAAYVSDVTYPDYTQINKDTPFVKTWRLQNTGSCTWTSGYKLIFNSGDRMDAPGEVTLTGVTIPPGGTVDASVNLKSPSSAGTYQGFFKLKSPEGQVFGIGGDAGGAFYVIIEVVIPPAAPPGITLMPLLPVPMVPLPLLVYSPSYVNAISCMGGIVHKIRIENTGGRTIESWSMSVTDNTTSTLIGTNGSDQFASTGDCISIALPRFDKPNSGYVSFKENSDLTGHNITANLKVCTSDGLGGVCVDKAVSFVAQ